MEALENISQSLIVLFALVNTVQFEKMLLNFGIETRQACSVMVEWHLCAFVQHLNDSV